MKPDHAFMNTDQTFDVMEFSTAHVEEEDLGRVEGTKYASGRDEYGIWVWAGSQGENTPETYEELKEENVSDDLIAALRKANVSACRYARFDQDGPVHEDLPENEW